MSRVSLSLSSSFFLPFGHTRNSSETNLPSKRRAPIVMASNGTAFAAFFAMAMGAWLIDSGIQGRHPIKALEDVIRNPTKVQDTLANDKGQFVPVSTLVGGSGGSGTVSTPKVSSTASAEQSYAEQQFSKYGWGSDQLQPLIDLWDKESGWNPKASNPSSGAYGIPQSLPASKMAAAGPDYLTNPATQIDWGLSYIKSRYGSPAKAEQHELSMGWY